MSGRKLFAVVAGIVVGVIVGLAVVFALIAAIFTPVRRETGPSAQQKPPAGPSSGGVGG